MKLLQIRDPNSVQQKEQEVDIAVGIDLGTTNSVVTVYINDKVEVIEVDNDSKLLKSLVAVIGDKLEVGSNALSMAMNKSCYLIIKSVKKLMGKGITEIPSIEHLNLPIDIENSNKIIKIITKNQSYLTPEEVSAAILKKLKEKAEHYLNKQIKKAVITVPAYFNESARIATKNAAKLAGLEVLRLINEPTSAALAYGLDEGLEGLYLIYDFGGGTFDISILKLEKGIFRVLATKGDVNLGGDDIDELISDKINLKLKEEYNIDDLDNSIKRYIVLKAKELKEILSNQNICNINININNCNIDFTMLRKELEEMMTPIIKKTLYICFSAIKDANIDKNDIKGLVLVGGSTRIPLLHTLLKDSLNVELYCSINPDEVVAIGAGYQAANLVGLTKRSLLLDVIPLSLGIETMGGLTEKIIFRNTPTPIAKAQNFTTFKDNQTAMSIHIVQGEREMAKDNQSLARFSLKGIPPMVAGAAKIEVTFLVDADGLLTVTAEEKSTGEKQEIEIKPSFGLTVEEIKNMIVESMKNSEEDMLLRLLKKSKVEAEQIINATKSAILQDGKLLSKKNLSIIQTSMLELENALDDSDRDKIDNLSKDLLNKTEKFAELRMNKYIKQSLEGKNIKDISN